MNTPRTPTPRVMPRLALRTAGATAMSLLVPLLGLPATHAGATTTHTTQPYSGQTIVVDYPTPPPGPALLKEFTQKTGIKVQWNDIQFDALVTKATTALTAHVFFADITHFGLPLMGQYTGSHWFIPINRYLNLASIERLVPLAKGFVHGGQLVAVPLDSSVGATTINVADFNRAGIHTVPRTFSQWVADLERLQKTGVSPHPLALPLAPAEALSIQWYIFTRAFGGQVFGPNYQPLFASPSSAGYKALAWIVNAYKSGLIPPADIDYTDTQTQQDQMAQNRTASDFVDYTDNVDEIYNNPKLSKVVRQVEYIPTPGLHGPVPNIEFPDSLLIPATARHPGAAAAFINFLEQPKVNAQLNGLDGPNYAIPGFTGPPSGPAALQLMYKAGKLPTGPILAQLSANTQPAVPQGAPKWYTQFSASAYDNINAAAAGNETVAQAVSAIVKTINKLRATA